MFKLLQRFIREEEGQDFAEYALILGAIGVVAIAVIARYRNELIAAFLNAQGLQVVEFGASTGTASRTKVILYTSKLYALRYLKDLFGLESQQIVIQPDPASSVDIEIRLGEDWIGNGPGG